MFQWLDHIGLKRSLCIITGVAALMAALASLSWRMVHDVPVMLYLSNMVMDGAVPYRDFFDMNLPGSYLVYGLIVKVLGATDVAVHFSNMLFLALIGALLVLACPKPFRLCALFGVALATLRCYHVQFAFVLQRELIALVPVSALLALALRGQAPGAPKSILAGLLLAALVLMKPQFVLYGLPQLVLLMMRCPDWRNRAYHLAIIGAAFSAPVLLCAFWLVRSGAWPAFLEMVQYWGLYGQMTFNCRFVTPAERFADTLRGIWKMLATPPYAIVAVLGLLVMWRKQRVPRRLCVALGALFLLTLAIPAATGQFWGYHRLPFYYVALFLSGFLLMSNRFIVACVCIPMAVVWTSSTAIRVYGETVTHPSISALKHGVPDCFADYLKTHAAPGDRAQPIDWAEGALHGMLMADVPLATRFPYAFYFLHSVSHPLIKKIRSEFLARLDETQPRFLLETRTGSRPSGIDTETHFQAFEQWRNAHYRLAQESEHYRIWELSPQ